MYTLFSGLYKHLTQKEEYYVIILGLDNAGKTTLLEKIKSIFSGTPGIPPEKIAPTVGLNIGKISLADGRSRLNFWDLGGQRDLRSLWEKYYAESHGVVFVIDSGDAERLEECRVAFEKIITSDTTEGVPIIVLANKQDLPNSLKVHEIKEVFNRIALRLGARESAVRGVSALTGENVKEAVEWLADRIQRNRQHRPPVFRQ
ncbi:ADP-ribosylation factor family-domain-containing protein [Hyaloraphidium curvatum]|nr:ADP-ribosylation factor family-domain-containing protein [Hyaloraphidium curvatum]